MCGLFLTEGKNSNQEKKKLKQNITLKELFDMFIEKHTVKNNKPQTINIFFCASNLPKFTHDKLPNFTQNNHIKF
jgi:hypothetical protein